MELSECVSAWQQNRNEFSEPRVAGGGGYCGQGPSSPVAESCGKLQKKCGKIAVPYPNLLKPSLKEQHFCTSGSRYFRVFSNIVRQSSKRRLLVVSPTWQHDPAAQGGTIQSFWGLENIVLQQLCAKAEGTNNLATRTSR